MNINWNKDTRANARLLVSDGVITSYVSEDQLHDGFTLRQAAEAYAATYDHNGNDNGYVVAQIEDLTDGDSMPFAFDAAGNFEWNTARDFVHY